MRVLRAALVAALAAAGCASGLNYTECNTNDDCASRGSDGGKLFCTNDHFCVLGLPDEQLCDDSMTIGTDGPGSLVVAVLYQKGLQLDDTIAQAAQLAASEINQRQGGAASAPAVVAHFCDIGLDSVQATRASHRAIDFYHAAALIGPTTSGAVVGVAGYAKQTGTLVMTPSATSAEITSLDDANLVWRTCPSDNLQSVALAQLVLRDTKTVMGQPKVDTVHVTSVYGNDLETAFGTQWSKLMGPALAARAPFDKPGDIPTALNAIDADGPTHTVLIADAEDPALLAQIGSGKFPALATTQFYMTDAAKTPDLFGAMGSMDPTLLARIHGTAPSTPSGPTYDTFRTSFKNKFNTDPGMVSYAATTYDAMYLVAIAAAFTQGHVPTGKEIATGLTHVIPDGQAVPIDQMDYLTAIKQIVNGKGVHLDGASGPLEFDAFGDLTSASYDCWSIDTNSMPPKFVSPKCM